MILLRLSLLAAAALLTACGTTGTLCGCDDSCTATASCPDTTTTTGPTCPADPDDGDVTPDCGIWASATLGDDSNPGTQEAPVRTLQRAVDLAGTDGSVYACAETYDTPVVIPSGVSLSGEWFCQNGWSRTAARATIRPLHDVIPLTLVAGSGTSTISGVVAVAADAANPGESSIAVLADVDAAAELRRVEARAGDGAPGADGANGGVQPATAGASGAAGFGACSADIGMGGLAPSVTCDDGVSIGGVGGDGSDSAAQGGGDGLPDLGAGNGGKGEAAAPVCTGGTNGEDGMPGQDGVGALAGGTLAASGYVGPAGASGTPGTRAQGGGGGGASYGKAAGGVLPHGGAGGGARGAGGRGVRGGWSAPGTDFSSLATDSRAPDDRNSASSWRRGLSRSRASVSRVARDHRAFSPPPRARSRAVPRSRAISQSCLAPTGGANSAGDQRAVSRTASRWKTMS